MQDWLFTGFFIVVGLCFGSFALATAWRLRHKKDFVKDTSECEKCHHKLSAKDLIPLVSWIASRGKCRYCGARLSPLLPAAELTGAAVFGLSAYAWPYGIAGFGLVLFIVWSMSLVLLLILFFYDLQWYILPNKVIYPLWVVSSVFAALRLSQDFTALKLALLGGSVAVAAGLFYVLYEISKGKWIGFGDVRLGLAIGLFVGHPVQAGIVLFIASLIGVAVALPGLMSRKSHLTSKLPFGPLLITALVIVVLFGERLSDWYLSLVAPV